MSLLAPWYGVISLALISDVITFGRCNKHPQLKQSTSNPTVSTKGCRLKRSDYAFVTMAHDADETEQVEGSGNSLLHALALARTLQRVSRFPLVVLSNSTHFTDGSSSRQAFCRLNAHLRPVYDIIHDHNRTPRIFKHFQWKLAFWKIQIWRLTQFTKLIWLDIDAVLYRGIDWLFWHHGTWAMRNSYWCNMDADRMCGGLIMLEPSERLYQEILEYSDAMVELVEGDQMLLHNFFNSSSSGPIRLLDNDVAAWGHCLFEVPPIPVIDPQWSYVPSVWRVPAFVHKSSIMNQCFTLHLVKQFQFVEGNLVNICTYHPLASYWRDNFCEAVRRIELRDLRSKLYCDDRVWYQVTGGVRHEQKKWQDEAIDCVHHGSVYILIVAIVNLKASNGGAALELSASDKVSILDGEVISFADMPGGRSWRFFRKVGICCPRFLTSEAETMVHLAESHRSVDIMLGTADAARRAWHAVLNDVLVGFLKDERTMEGFAEPVVGLMREMGDQRGIDQVHEFDV